MENMLDLDPPAHGRLRALVQKAFTPRLVEQLRPRVEDLADGLVRDFRCRPHFDCIRDYALPIPTTVIAEMLGVPTADRHKFHRWPRAIVAANPSGLGMLLVLPRVWAFLRYLRRLIQMKRAAPADDLLTALVRAEEAGDQLSEDELVAMAFLLLVAGHETTVNLIGNGVLALLEHTDQMERLRAEPKLIEPAVEELLRFARPLETATERYAREDMVVAGVVIPRGSVRLRRLGLGQPRRGAVPGPGPAGRGPGAQPAPGFRTRPALLPGGAAGPDGGAGGDRDAAAAGGGPAAGRCTRGPAVAQGAGAAWAQIVAGRLGGTLMNAEVLLWCAVINYGLLLVWVALFVLPHGWLHRLWGRWFRLSAEQFDLVNFAGIVLYKSAVLLFNLVPYIALRIVG
jgi:hypothetical protein